MSARECSVQGARSVILLAGCGELKRPRGRLVAVSRCSKVLFPAFWLTFGEVVTQTGLILLVNHVNLARLQELQKVASRPPVR